MLDKASFNKIFKNRPLIIAGPCSAESREQLIDTAGSLKSFDIQLFRAGIWKQRTRLASFPGVGDKGLLWLREVKERFNMLVATEVANPRHVEKALAQGIDIFWLGARTTANPFVVSEISQALKGTAIPVFVKNPINPDIGLWIGALERLDSAGIDNIAVIHRGFSVYEKSIYRNPPIWELALEFKREFPHIPMLCDPSHIAGNKRLILPISQKALDLDYAGLMIESHVNPAEALSDSEQQITPAALRDLVGFLGSGLT